MSAPKGNEFWKLRGKHGRDRIIQDPEALLENAYEYFKWCKENPLLVTDFKGTRQIEKVHYDKPRPFTKEGVAIYCGVHAWKVISDLKEVSQDFSKIVTHIEQIIYNQKFEWASIGVFNSSIIARDLGLTDKTENKQTSTGEIKIVVDEKHKKNLDDALGALDMD